MKCLKKPSFHLYIAKPAVPTGLQASSIERTTIDLSWNAVPGAKSYRIKQFEKDVITVSGTTHSVKNLLAGKGYKFAVAGENMAGVGVFSAFLTVTTEKFGICLSLFCINLKCSALTFLGRQSLKPVLKIHFSF